MKIIHKIRAYKAIAFSMCGTPLHITGGLSTDEWEHTTCKACLKKKERK